MGKKIKIWLHNQIFFIKHYLRLWWLYSITWISSVWNEVKKKENTDVRVGVFIFFYLLFSIVGAYNFAHLMAFGYIIWLLERQHGN